MRRVVTILMLLLSAGAQAAEGQAARCRLAPRPYGFGGVCRLEYPEGRPGRSLRLSFPDSVRIWMTGGPEDPAPWRGNVSLPATDVAFEIATVGGARDVDRYVFRTGLASLPVTEWRPIDRVQPVCASCDRRSRDVLLVLDLVNPPQATADDIAILSGVLERLNGLTRWNRREVQECTASDGMQTGLFCLLYTSVEAQMGRYHHRQPALELVRAVVLERWRDRITSHPLVDLNNHPATTMADLRVLLQVALDRAREQTRTPGQ